ncbi:MAG: leucyl aminopeptidase [Helicobacteraceae bacterium]
MEVSVKKQKCDYEIEFASKSATPVDLKKEAEFLGYEFEEASAVHLRAFKKILVTVNDENDAENFKLGAAAAWDILRALDVKSASVKAKKSALGAIAEGFLLGSYEFNKYKSKPKKPREKLIVLDGLAARDLEQIQAVCGCVNFARDLVNSHPDEIYPASFVEYVKKNLKDLAITAKVLDKAAIEKEKMNALLAVNRASRHDPRVLHLSYKPKTAKKRVVLVGKGLTYDSGGLSLKPSDYMVTMKADKGGATAAVAAIMAAARLGLDLEIHAIAGLAENMIGGDAYKPDDVLVARNGKTIEVRNTDAEGRLVLADCLDYAAELKPDLLIDLATLTGACVVGVGEYTIGVMGHSAELKNRALLAGKNSGELTADLPFNRYLKKLLKSDVADMSNVSGSRYGGAITAGLFLDNFVDEKLKDKWLHLDIAGPAYVEKKWGYNPSGASGAGVRLLVSLLKDL